MGLMANRYVSWGGLAGVDRASENRVRFLASVRKKYDLAYEWRKELAAVVRGQMKQVKADAKAIARSKGLPKLAKTVSTRTRARKRHEGVTAILSGSGFFNIWIHGRKAYDIVPKNRKVLKLPGGFAKRVHLKEQAPRPVLMPAVRNNEQAMNEAIREKMADTVARGLSRTIEIKAT